MHETQITMCLQIRLQVRRTVCRKNSKPTAQVFSDRDVDAVKDGHVSCESYKEKKAFMHVSSMDRGVQVCTLSVIIFFFPCMSPILSL